MYKKLTILLLLIIFSCAGVMRTYYVKTHYDEFDNFNVYEQFYNRNKTGALWEDALNVRIIKYDDQRTKYSIIIYKENPDVWLYANQPLKIKADDDLLEFSFINEKSHILAANNVQKWGYYLADKESIYKIYHEDDSDKNINHGNDFLHNLTYIGNEQYRQVK